MNTSSSYLIEDLANHIGAKLLGPSGYLIHGFNDLEKASTEEITFFATNTYKKKLEATKAKAIIVSSKMEPIPNKTLLLHDDPMAAFEEIVRLMKKGENHASGFLGIHPSAIIHPSVKLGKEISIGPLVVIDRDVEIGDHTVIDAGCVLYPNVKVGSYCRFYARVTIREGSLIGDRVILQPGSVIGSCGFGYRPDPKLGIVKLEQLGIVELKNDVEIGANTTIDRAHFVKTTIDPMAKIDNLVQIAHNVSIGKGVMIASQAGVAGSTKVGDFSQIGGQVGIAGHCSIAPGTRIAAQSGVPSSIEVKGDYMGSPTLPIFAHHRLHARLKNLNQLFERVSTIEKILNPYN